MSSSSLEEGQHFVSILVFLDVGRTNGISDTKEGNGSSNKEERKSYEGPWPEDT